MEKKSLDAFSRITLPASLRHIEYCDWCKKPLPKRSKIHHNRCQDPPIHKFCSQPCKVKWCASQQPSDKITKSKKN